MTNSLPVLCFTVDTSEYEKEQDKDSRYCTFMSDRKEQNEIEEVTISSAAI